jgi:hypothetical protein
MLDKPEEAKKEGEEVMRSGMHLTKAFQELVNQIEGN